MSKRAWISGLLFVTAMSALAVAGPWLRRVERRTCEYDAARIEPANRVRVVDCCGRDHEFCCVTCAELWLKRSGIEPQAIHVTDESSGTEISAESAIFVRSMVSTNPVIGDRIHAFRDANEAEKHSRFARGQILGEAERPFRAYANRDR
ncbi:MAG TPA: hypothetical protein VHR66_18320 [Gemmataceae bacterium]|jgi:hypothetical protein|nr:hypothetical protein [Gemmataceae bacterium]